VLIRRLGLVPLIGIAALVLHARKTRPNLSVGQ
jgi:hypothetical protein